VHGSLITSADVVVQGYIASAHVLHARGDTIGAHRLLDDALRDTRERAFAEAMVRRLRAAHAQLALLRGEQETALRWATASGTGVDDPVTFLREREYLTLARVYIAQGRRDPQGPGLDDAQRLLERWLHAATDGERWDSVIELLVLRALVLAAQGDEHAALVALDHALDRAAPEGYVRIFVDEGDSMRALLGKLKVADPQAIAYVATLLAAFSADRPTHLAPVTQHERASALAVATSSILPLAEALTEREMHVLRLLAAGASNQGIADHLVISLPTAKKHVANILGKLDAHNRTEAVARARALHLL
jgi:LuxR family maltose regulon positive regulatory protein